jgi:uncharacterized protein YkvS
MERNKLKLSELHIGDFVCYSKLNGYCTIVDQIRHTHDDSGDVIYFSDGVRDLIDTVNPGVMDSFALDLLYSVKPVETSVDKKDGLLDEAAKEFEIVIEKINDRCRIIDTRGSEIFKQGGRFVIAELQNLVEKYGKAIPKKSLISFIEKF